MDQQVTLRLVDVVPLRNHQRSIVAGVHRGIVDAGLLDAQSLRYHFDREHELLVGEPLPVKVDGRAEPHGRALRLKHNSSGERTGTDAVIPVSELEVGLGIESEAVVDSPEEQPLVALYAGEYDRDGERRGVIALGRPPEETISTAVLGTKATDPMECPVDGCSYGADQSKNFAQVQAHVNSKQDDAHRAVAEARDWSYEQR